MQISHEDLFNQKSTGHADHAEDAQSEKDGPIKEAEIDSSGIITVRKGPREENPFPTHAMLANGKFGGQLQMTGSRKVSTKDGMLLSRDLI